MTRARATRIGYDFIGLARSQYLPCVSAEHILEEARTARCQRSGDGQSAIARIHYEEDMLSRDERAPSCEVVPSKQGGEVRRVAIDWYKKAHLAPAICASKSVAGEEHHNAVILRHPLGSHRHIGAPDRVAIRRMVR